jgi:hypothetical protein
MSSFGQNWNARRNEECVVKFLPVDDTDGKFDPKAINVHPWSVIILSDEKTFLPIWMSTPQYPEIVRLFTKERLIDPKLPIAPSTEVRKAISYAIVEFKNKCLGSTPLTILLVSSIVKYITFFCPKHNKGFTITTSPTLDVAYTDGVGILSVQQELMNPGKVTIEQKNILAVLKKLYSMASKVKDLVKLT